MSMRLLPNNNKAKDIELLIFNIKYMVFNSRKVSLSFTKFEVYTTLNCVKRVFENL